MLDFPTDLSLPYGTGTAPGIGGHLRASPAHFVVDEVPLYEAEGVGGHLYVNLTKVGLTTKEVQRRLERLLALRPEDIGYAGLKDKRARTTQTFSLNLEGRTDHFVDEAVSRISGELPVTVNWVRRHRNKLKAGHLLGNRFAITISDVTLPEDELKRRVQLVQALIAANGLPNFYGPQRFGAAGDNVSTGYDLLLGRRKVADRWVRRFLLSSLQSFLCNQYLARRLAEGAFGHLLAGDVAKKYATGGLFAVTDLAAEEPRYQAQEISFTAPIYGPKMWFATAEAGVLEAAVLQAAEIRLEDFGRAKVEGSRRLGRLLVPDIASEVGAGRVTLSFFLPKGAYATSVVREFMKVELSDAPVFDGDE